MNDQTKNLIHILKTAKENRIEVEENSENPGLFIIQDDGTEIKIEWDEMINKWFPIEEGNNRLQNILSTMTVPEHRKNDLGWLFRNLGVGTNNPNRTHPEYWEAMQLISEEIKKERNKNA